MFALDRYTMTHFERRYRQAVLDLFLYHLHTHCHLDWHEIGQWLDLHDAPIQLAWYNGRLVGVMAASLPLNGTCWLRLVGVADGVPPAEVLHALWGGLRDSLRGLGVENAALLVIHDWLVPFLPGLGFGFDEDIVTFRRDSSVLPARPGLGVTVRSAALEDIPRMTLIDQSAFSPPWQMTQQDLRQAQRIAAVCTVAVQQGTLIGYQLSTLHRQSGHLARLAVLPAAQGKGVGAVLLDDLIRRFIRRGVHIITLNTQNSNIYSQRLYERYGFARNGYDLGVWHATP